MSRDAMLTIVASGGEECAQRLDGVVTSLRQLSPEQRHRLRLVWDDAFRGPGGRVLILPRDGGFQCLPYRPQWTVPDETPPPPADHASDYALAWSLALLAYALLLSLS